MGSYGPAFLNHLRGQVLTQARWERQKAIEKTIVPVAGKVDSEWAYQHLLKTICMH